MSQFTPIFPLTIKAAAAGLVAETFVTHLGALPAAAANAAGVTRSASVAVGEVLVVDTMGTAIALSGAAFAAGAALELDAAGKLITKAAGVTVARAMQGKPATAANQRVEVFLIPN